MWFFINTIMSDRFICSIQIDARNSRNGEIIFKDNFSTSVAGIVEVSEADKHW